MLAWTRSQEGLAAATDSIDPEARANPGCSFVGLSASYSRYDSVGLLASLGVWLERLVSLKSAAAVKRFLPLLPAGSTLSDALRVHRAMRQSGRQPSKVMQEPDTMMDDPALQHLTATGTAWAVIGAHALAAHGVARFTVDVDVLVMTPTVAAVL